MDFVKVHDEELDGGFGLPLKRIAMAQGSPEAVVRLLLSPSVQQALRTAFVASGASSLPAERRFAQIKRSEAPRLCHLAVASRNQVQRQFLAWREGRLQRLEAARRALSRAKVTNVASLAWAARPDLLPTPGAGSRRQAAVNVGGDFAALAEQHVANREGLREEVARLRAAAQAELSEAEAGNVPLTKAAWAEWFTEHYSEFSQHMRTATQERRALSCRLVADCGLPPGARRLG